jgi:hypothetical protein
VKKHLAARLRHGNLFLCGHSLMVKLQPSKLAMRVRFPLPASSLFTKQNKLSKTSLTWLDVLTEVLTNYGINH